MIILLLILAASIPTEWDATDVEGYVMAWGVEPVTLEPGRSHYTVKGLQDCEEYEVSILAYRGIRNSEKAYIVGMPSVKLRRVRIGEPVHIGPRMRLVTFRGKNFAPGVQVELGPDVTAQVQSSSCEEIVALLMLDEGVRGPQSYRVMNPDGTYADGRMRFGRRWR